jgi:hypothetical protein
VRFRTAGVAYAVGGVMMSPSKRAEGHPHYHFWKEVAGLVRLLCAQ